MCIRDRFGSSAPHNNRAVEGTTAPLPCEYGCASAAPYFLEPYAAQARAAYGACTLSLIHI
eukprot:2547746-Alexandrium_andersonii.AAC.1